MRFKKYVANLVHLLFCSDYNNDCKCKIVKGDLGQFYIVM